jgi:hypothetical protein
MPRERIEDRLSPPDMRRIALKAWKPPHIDNGFRYFDRRLANHRASARGGAVCHHRRKCGNQICLRGNPGSSQKTWNGRRDFPTMACQHHDIICITAFACRCADKHVRCVEIGAEVERIRVGSMTQSNGSAIIRLRMRSRLSASTASTSPPANMRSSEPFARSSRTVGPINRRQTARCGVVLRNEQRMIGRC